MPASTRPHRTLAVIVHCLGALTALPALTTPDAPRAVTAPAVAPASPPAHAAPARPPTTQPDRPAAGKPTAPPAVRVNVAPASTPAPAYRIEVRNDGAAPVDTTVRQELPPGAAATRVTAGGRATRPTGRTEPAEVTWRLTLPAHSSTTLDTALTAASDQPLTAPACAFAGDGDGDRAYDCATATWRQATDDAGAGRTPFWRTPALVAGVALVPVLAGTGWWLLRRRRGGATATGPTGAPDPAGQDGRSAGRGTLYPRAALPSPAYRRRRPPVWLVVGVAAVALVGTVGAAAWTATTRVAAIGSGAQPTSGAWAGPGHAGALGVPLREAAFEFTVYRMACAGSPEQRRCQATVGVRNLTTQQQLWHGELQRAYLPDGRWVNADEPATRAANQGRDVFAEPVAAEHRMVVPLVFTVAGPEPPDRVELRSGVFSAGVRVNVP